MTMTSGIHLDGNITIVSQDDHVDDLLRQRVHVRLVRLCFDGLGLCLILFVSDFVLFPHAAFAANLI